MRRLTRLLLLIPTLVALTTMPAQATEAATGLAEVLAARSADDKARDADRHPAETLAFFGVEPGMTVAETLPGSGWYTRILTAYLGSDGTLYGVNYSDRMWPLFSWATEEVIKQRIAATGNFPAMVRGFADDYAAAKSLDPTDVMPAAEGFTFNTVPPEVVGKVDRVLMIRALHNLNRFEDTAGTRSQALAAVRAMLKEDGLVGVVQHRLPESAADAGADGSRGYLKQSAVIAMFEAAGFELVKTSEINANPKDQPGPDDIVWRLPPSLSGSKDDPERRAAMVAIGESDRMTLVFRRATM
jgi:predicted methyltransferase